MAAGWLCRTTSFLLYFSLRINYRAPRRCQHRRDSGGQGRGNQSWAVKIRAFRVREDREVSPAVLFGPFFSALELSGGSRSARSGAVPKGEVRKE